MGESGGEGLAVMDRRVDPTTVEAIEQELHRLGETDPALFEHISTWNAWNEKHYYLRQPERPTEQETATLIYQAGSVVGPSDNPDEQWDPAELVQRFGRARTLTGKYEKVIERPLLHAYFLHADETEAEQLINQIHFPGGGSGFEAPLKYRLSRPKHLPGDYSLGPSDLRILAHMLDFDNRAGGDHSQWLVGWSYASTDLIRTTHRSLEETDDVLTLVSAEQTWEHVFEGDSETPPYDPELAELMRASGQLSYLPTEVITGQYGKLYLQKYSEELEAVLVRGRETPYPIEVIAQSPWLERERARPRYSKDKLPYFPYEGDIQEQAEWISLVAKQQLVTEDVAEFISPKIAQTIINRLDQGIDETLHDCLYWMGEFVPRRDSAWQYHEQSIIARLVKNPELLRYLSKKPRVLESLFPEHSDVVIDLIENPSDDLEAQAAQTMSRTRIFDSYDSYKDEPFTGLLQKIKQFKVEYETDLRENPAWLVRHGMTERTKLERAFSGRKQALTQGVADNPTAICAWMDTVSFWEMLGGFQQRGELKDINPEELRPLEPFIAEIMRVTDPNTGFKKIMRLHKEGINPSQFIPHFEVELEDGYKFEILKKEDPRGFSIGADTGCCMSPGGEAESCIWAGYQEESYGFAVVTKDGAIQAQSLLYVNNDRAPDTVVIDNIEACDGTNGRNIRAVYRAGFEHLGNQSRYQHAHIGTGQSDVPLGDLARVQAIPRPNHRVYTDAKSQRVLI